MKTRIILFFTLIIAGLLSAQVSTYKIENGALVLGQPILFETGSDKLKPESDAALQIIKNYLDDKTYITLMRIEGHVSAYDEAMNQKLSEKRAMSVCRWLITKGIKCDRLIAVGFGSTKPIADNSTSDGKIQNTRIAAVNAALKGRAIGGMPVDGGGKVAGDVCK